VGVAVGALAMGTRVGRGVWLLWQAKSVMSRMMRGNGRKRLFVRVTVIFSRQSVGSSWKVKMLVC
jgi:hypothetical protein